MTHVDLYTFDWLTLKFQLLESKRYRWRWCAWLNWAPPIFGTFWIVRDEDQAKGE